MNEEQLQYIEDLIEDRHQQSLAELDDEPMF